MVYILGPWNKWGTCQSCGNHRFLWVVTMDTDYWFCMGCWDSIYG